MVDPADSKSAVCKDVRVRLSPRAQKDLENRNIFIIFVVESSLILLFYIWMKMLINLLRSCLIHLSLLLNNYCFLIFETFFILIYYLKF